METLECRSKEEVLEAIENNRREMRGALRGTREAWGVRNPAVVAWKATKTGVINTKDKIVDKTVQAKNRVLVKAYAADQGVRQHVYQAIGIALCAGALVGYWATKKFRS